MQICTNCGATLQPNSSHCHVCAVATPYQKTQHTCLNCGAPAAQAAKTCIMCGNPLDTLPKHATTFGVSWLGFGIGLVIITGLAYWFFQIQPIPVANVSNTPIPPTIFIPPTNTPPGTQTPTPSQTPTPTLTPVPPTATPTPIIHTIRRGETLLFLADKYDVTVDDIIRANDVTERTILQLGQELIIPVVPTGPPPPGSIITHTVRAGDTVSDISFIYDVSLADIIQANPDLDLDFLSIGQKLTIPIGEPIVTATPIPTPTFTPRAPFYTPYLLLPADEALIEGDEATVLLNWTAMQILAEDTFYVIFITDEAGNRRTYWTQTSSYRLPAEARPTKLTTYSWYVVIMEKLGIDENDIFYGRPLSEPSETRTFRWR